MGEGRGRREQYHTAGSAQRGNPCSTEASHSSPSGGRYLGEGLIPHPHQPLDSGALGPGARPKALSCRQPHLGLFSVSVRRFEERRATGHACRGAHSRLLTRSSLRSPGGPGVRSRSLWLVGRSFNCRISALGMVAGGRGASWCPQPMGRRFRFNPCMPGWFSVGRLACRLFTVGSFFLQQFGWYPGVSAALWSAGASRGRLRCSPRWCSRVLSWLSSWLVRRFVVSGPPDVAVRVRRGHARRVVFVRCRRGSQSLAPWGLCGGLYWPGRPRLAAVGSPLRHWFPVGRVLS